MALATTGNLKVRYHAEKTTIMNMTPANQDLQSPHSFTWTGSPILGACAVNADYGTVLFLTKAGTLHGVDVATSVCVNLCAVALPAISEDDGHTYFGAATYRLYSSRSGGFAAIVVDHGRHGVVVDVRSGAVTMHLDGGDYHQDTVPFSACFIRFQGRDVFIHRTDWNRLDAADPATGASLTDRFIGTDSRESPEHYLDYFHGQLRPSPDGSRLFDDGWVWQPVGILRTWSVHDWLTSNPWESEDGASVRDLIMRDWWTMPACWISDTHLAIWGLSDWEGDEFFGDGKGDGVRIFDATIADQESAARWPMEITAARVNHLFSDGQHLYVAADTGTTVWDLTSRSYVDEVTGFSASIHDAERHCLLAVAPNEITELSLAKRARLT
jgi:hypothetical protein